MRVECPKCSELAEPHSILIVAHRVTVRCARCDYESCLEMNLASETKEASDDCCPKCEGPVEETTMACPSCGLGAANFEEFAAAVAKAGDNHLLDESWQRLLDDWDSDETHEAFVIEVVKTSSYREAARKYRDVASDEARRVRANRMLERIQTMATATLLATPRKNTAEPEPFRNVIVMLLVLLLLAAAGGIYAMMKTNDTGRVEIKRKVKPTIMKAKPPRSGAK